jgi:hypothetical protein
VEAFQTTENRTFYEQKAAPSSPLYDKNVLLFLFLTYSCNTICSGFTFFRILHIVFFSKTPKTPINQKTFPRLSTVLLKQHKIHCFTNSVFLHFLENVKNCYIKNRAPRVTRRCPEDETTQLHPIYASPTYFRISRSSSGEIWPPCR